MGPDGKPEVSPEDAAAAACWANDNLSPEQKRMAAQEVDKQNGNTQVGRTNAQRIQRRDSCVTPRPSPLALRPSPLVTSHSVPPPLSFLALLQACDALDAMEMAEKWMEENPKAAEG